MPTLFDTKTREPITLQDHEIADAVATGKASFKINDVIPVISPDGTAGTLPATQIKDALADGFQIESPRQTAVREYVKSKDNLQGSAEVALKQFANQALFDVPQTALNLTDPLEAQKWEALKADHQLANAIGGVTGFGASLSYGGPLIDAAGQGAERLVAKSLADYGIKRGAETVAKDVTARIAENAARIGVESAAFATPKAATEAFNGDPELAAETLISNGAFGLGLGVLGGLAGKGVSTLTKSFNGSALEGDALKAAKSLSQEDNLVATLAQKNPEDIAYTKTNLKRMESTPSLDEAAEKSIPKMFKEDFDQFQNVELPAIEKKVGGILDQAKIKMNTKDIEGKIDNIINDIKVNEGATEQSEKAIKRMEDYKRRLIPVDEAGIPQYKDLTGKQVRKYLQGLRKDNSAFRKLNSPMGGDFTLPETVLMDLSEGISEDLKRAVGPEYRTTMEDYARKVKLSNALDKQLSVTNAFQNRIKKPIQDQALGGYSTISFNDKANNWFKNIEDFGKLTGKDYPTMIKDRLVYAKMFPEKALKGEAPTLTAKIADLAGKIDLSKPFQTVANVLVPKSEDLLHAYVSNGSILKATQKTLGAFATIPQRLQKFISKSTPVSVETSSVGAIGRMLGNDAPKDRKEQLKKMNEKLSEFTQNPAMSTEHLSQITKQLQPNLAQSVTAKNVAIAQYLQNTIPKPKVPPSPFNKYTWEPSAHELSQFERRVQAVNDPTSILDSLENGSLSKEEVETAQTIYPKLFEQMQSKIIEALTDHDKPVPYSSRIKLSLLMGQPFDNSLNAQVIQAYQANFNKMDQSQPSQGVEMPSMQTNIDSIATKSS